MEKLNYNSIATDLKSEIKSVQIEVLRLIFRTSVENLPKRENLIFLILNKVFTSEDTEIVFFARKALSTILNKKSLEYKIFDENMDLKTDKLCNKIRTATPGDVVTILANFSKKIVTNLKSDEIIDALLYRVRKSPRTLVITFILKLMPYIQGRDDEIYEMLPGFLNHKNIYVVACAIEAMGHFKREDCLPLVANYLNSNKTILKNVSVKTIISIDKSFAMNQIKMMIERGNEMDIANAYYLTRFFDPDNEFMEFIVEILLQMPNGKMDGLMKVLFQKLDSSNYKCLLNTMAAEANTDNIVTIKKIKRFILEQFGIDEETMTFIENFQLKPLDTIVEEDIEDNDIDNNLVIDIDKEKKNEQILTKPEKIKRVIKKKKIEKKPVKPKSAKKIPIQSLIDFDDKRVIGGIVGTAVVILIIIIYILWPSSSEEIIRNTVTSKSKITPKSHKISKPSRKKPKFGNKFLQSLPRNVKINGIITEIVKNRKKGKVICFMRQGNIIFKVDINDNKIAEKLSPGSEVTLKAKLEKTDALGVVHLTCKKIL